MTWHRLELTREHGIGMGELVCIEYEYIIQYSNLMKKLRENEIE